MKELLMWLVAIFGILVGTAIAAMAAGFIFGLFVKFAKLAFFLTGA